MTNLELLYEAGNQYENQEAFEDYFIGILSVSVDAKTWKESLAAAQEYAARIHAHKPEKVA